MSNKSLVATLVAACALAAVADTLVFKSGSRLEGEVVRIVDVHGLSLHRRAASLPKRLMGSKAEVPTLYCSQTRCGMV